ncbi:MAG: hypothetical protein LBB83_02875, partial [Treponema sp.]|nr:hypothetical protein [Treponema sp.]
IMVYNSIYFFICQVSLFIQKIWFGISHNVSAVYDGLTARIKKCVAFLGLANCGCSEPWEGAQRLTQANETPSRYCGEA